MARIRRLAALAAGIALAGCYEIGSDVPAVTEASRATSAPMASGRYCGVGVELDETGAMELDYDTDCFDVAVEGGVLTVRSTDPKTAETLTLEVADLGRGLRLMQAWDAEDEAWQLYMTAMSEVGLAILEDTSRTPQVDAAAVAAGVTLTESSDIQIVAGEPDAVLGLLRDVAGSRFDAALRDEALRRDMIDEAAYYVRAAPDSESAGADEAAARAAVDGLVAIMGRAMALE
jgi:hypothetical protein